MGAVEHMGLVAGEQACPSVLACTCVSAHAVCMCGECVSAHACACACAFSALRTCTCLCVLASLCVHVLCCGILARVRSRVIGCCSRWFVYGARCRLRRTLLSSGAKLIERQFVERQHRSTAPTAALGKAMPCG